MNPPQNVCLLAVSFLGPSSNKALRYEIVYGGLDSLATLGIRPDLLGLKIDFFRRLRTIRVYTAYYGS